MKALARVFPQSLVSVQTIAVMMVIACCLFSMFIPRAHAAELTQPQKEAIVNLLQSFNADSMVVDNVSAALDSNVPLQAWLNGSAVASPTIPQVSQGQGGTASLLTTAARPAIAVACNVFSRTLRAGATGDDVAQLQAFLEQTGDLQETSTTNYFGPATQRALQAWQARTGVVASGDPDTTGFGALGPKTREALAAYCKNAGGGSTAATVATTSASAVAAPTCTLSATKSIIQKGESVVLYWESKNATYASSINGQNGPVRGQITLTPTETMTYIKKVYGPGGEGQCIKTVEVGNTVPASGQKVVVDYPHIELGRVFSLMGSGMAAVFEGYVSLFDFNQD